MGVLLPHRIPHCTSVAAAPGLAGPLNSSNLAAVAGGGPSRVARWACSFECLPSQNGVNLGPQISAWGGRLVEKLGEFSSVHLDFVNKLD